MYIHWHAFELDLIYTILSSSIDKNIYNLESGLDYQVKYIEQGFNIVSLLYPMHVF